MAACAFLLVYSRNSGTVKVEVETQDAVDAAHEAMVKGGWTVVHAPREYDYAVFVADPDGNRWEFAHIPIPTE